jgi:hypothetical protein
MVSEYSADTDGMLQGNSELKDVRERAHRIGPKFAENYKQFMNWWGVEGDDFGDQVGPGCMDEHDQTNSTVASFLNGLERLIDVLDEQAAQVKRPQDLAIEDIHAQDSRTGKR